GGGKLNATAVLLEPLSDEESSDLIDHLAGGTLDPPTRRRVIAAAEGNPLFVEEMLALAQEDDGATGELEVPPTIQALLAARLVEYEEIVGYHLERAFRYRSELGAVDGAARELGRRAAARLGAAGRRAFARSDASAGVNLISRAAALLPGDDPARIELIPNVRVMQGIRHDPGWAATILTDVAETGDARLRAHALVQRGFLRLFTDPTVTAEELIELSGQAVATFRSLPDELGLARAWRLAAQAHYLARRGEECASASEQALTHARRVGDAFEVKEIVEWLAVSLSLGSAPTVEVARRCDELLHQ